MLLLPGSAQQREGQGTGGGDERVLLRADLAQPAPDDAAEEPLTDNQKKFQHALPSLSCLLH